MTKRTEEKRKYLQVDDLEDLVKDKRLNYDQVLQRLLEDKEDIKRLINALLKNDDYKGFRSFVGI